MNKAEEILDLCDEVLSKKMTPEEKMKTLEDFDKWVGGALPSEHFWDEEDGEPGKNFYIGDNANLAKKGESALREFFEKFDNPKMELEELVALMKQFPDRMKKLLKSNPRMLAKLKKVK